MDSLNLGVTTYTVLSGLLAVALAVGGIVIYNNNKVNTEDSNENISITVQTQVGYLPSIEVSQVVNIVDTSTEDTSTEDTCSVEDVYDETISGQFETSKIDI